MDDVYDILKKQCEILRFSKYFGIHRRNAMNIKNGGKEEMKKIVALLFAIVMALSVCACEKTPAAVEEPTAAPATDAETPAPPPA